MKAWREAKRVFHCWQDYDLYRRARYIPDSLTAPINLRVRSRTERAFICRPGTSDPAVLWDTFFHGYHRPPAWLRKPEWIVDLGACVGYTAADLASRYPGARVLAVEMDTDNVRLCRANTIDYSPRCRVAEAAVWDRDGEVAYVGDESWSMRVNESGTRHSGSGTRQRAQGTRKKVAAAMTLAGIMDRYAVPRIDFLKMDIEGAEDRVLADPDAGQWASRVRLAKIELHPPAIAEIAAERLRSLGFTCRPDNRHPRCILAWR